MISKRRWSGLLTLVAALSMASIAGAQDLEAETPEAEAPGAEDPGAEDPGAEASGAQPSAGGGASISDATDEQKQAAQDHFMQGSEAFDAQRWDDAIAAFRASYNTVASPNSRLMLARALRGSGRYAEAYIEYQDTAEVAEEAAVLDEKYKGAATAARAEAEEIKGQLGFVTLDLRAVSPGATVRVQGRNIPPEDQGEPIVVNPGPVDVTVIDGANQKNLNAMVAPGQTAPVVVDFSPAQPSGPPPEKADDGDGFNPLDGGTDQRITAAIVTGVGVAGMVTFAIFGAQSSSAASDLEEGCPNQQCPPELAETADDGSSAQTIANVSLVVGTVFLAGGAALFATTLFGDDEGDTAKAELGVGPGSLTVRGTF